MLISSMCPRGCERMVENYCLLPCKIRQVVFSSKVLIPNYIVRLRNKQKVLTCLVDSFVFVLHIWMVELSKFEVGVLDFNGIRIGFDAEYLVVVRLVDSLTLHLAVFFLLEASYLQVSSHKRN